MSVMTVIENPTESPLEEPLVEKLKTIYDPEIPVDVWELGLIYELHINPDDTVFVKMTLTTPNCPAAGILPGQVEEAVKSVEGVEDARVELTFNPPYHRDMMSDVAKFELGFM